MDNKLVKSVVLGNKIQVTANGNSMRICLEKDNDMFWIDGLEEVKELVDSLWQVKHWWEESERTRQ